MRLIIKEYLAGLAERKELDALLPDLLLQMGLQVFSKPGVGNRQYGVDIAACGALEDDLERVYLFSLKSGDLGRSDWDGDSNQALRPSLNEIKDVYIPGHLPPEHRSKPVVICMCFGGDVKQEVELNVSMYEQQNTTTSLTYSKWNGDKLADYIERHLMREELLPEDLRSLLRKSLAMIDQPNASFKYFDALLESMRKKLPTKKEKLLVTLRQISLCTWILYSWCRKANNIEGAYLASESALLKSWDICKSFFGQRDKVSQSIHRTFNSVLQLHLQISENYMEKCIFPHASHLYSLSSAVSGSNTIDVNLKMFDVIGRLSIYGMWLHAEYVRLGERDAAIKRNLESKLFNVNQSLWQIIHNNPILETPYKDDQGIDIYLTAWFLMLNKGNWESVGNWLSEISGATLYLFEHNKSYPSNINNYSELLEHPIDNSEEYRKSVTQGSILYPYLSVFSVVLGFTQILPIIQQIKEKYLQDCTFQMWFPNEASENHMYSNSDNHGGTMTNIDIHKSPEEFIQMITDECKNFDRLKEMSAYKFGMWPIIMVACRHYRMPVPIKFLLDLYNPTVSKSKPDVP